MTVMNGEDPALPDEDRHMSECPKTTDEIVAELRGLSLDGYLGDFEDIVQRAADRLEELAQQATKGWPIKPGGPWELRWYGSGDDRGDHIFCEGERIAYLGDEHHDSASILVYHHNVGIGRRKCELCLGAGVAMARVQFNDGTCSQHLRPCPLCTPESEAQTRTA